MAGLPLPQDLSHCRVKASISLFSLGTHCCPLHVSTQHTNTPPEDETHSTLVICCVMKVCQRSKYGVAVGFKTPRPHSTAYTAAVNWSNTTISIFCPYPNDVYGVQCSHYLHVQQINYILVWHTTNFDLILCYTSMNPSSTMMQFHVYSTYYLAIT